jgi:hypothetical protein
MLSPKDLAALETMQNELADMAVRVADLMEKAKSGDSEGVWFTVAQRLSRVDDAFSVLDAVLVHACMEVEDALPKACATDNVVQFRPARRANEAASA